VIESWSLLKDLEFIWPWMFAFLPLPWLIRILLSPASKTMVPLVAPSIAQRIAKTLPKDQLIEPTAPQRRIPFAFALLWLLLILASMRPVWYLTPTPFQVSGKEMMLAVDLSGSMQKGDMYLGGQDVNRLVAVKAVVSDFVARRDGDRMGLVVFGSQAFLLSPLTYDLQTLKTLLNESPDWYGGKQHGYGRCYWVDPLSIYRSKINRKRS